MRTILHRIHVLGPNGQYFVKTPINVIGIVSRQRAESATARVAMKILRAVLIPEKQTGMCTTAFYTLMQNGILKAYFEEVE